MGCAQVDGGKKRDDPRLIAAAVPVTRRERDPVTVTVTGPHTATSHSTTTTHTVIEAMLDHKHVTYL